MSVRENVVIVLKGAVPVKKSTRKSPGSRSGGVTSTQVDPQVWATALKAADGDKSRLRIVSKTEVVILNGSR